MAETRRSARGHVPRQQFSLDVYEEEEAAKRAERKKRPKGRAAPPKSKWAAYERRVSAEIHKARSARAFPSALQQVCEDP